MALTRKTVRANVAQLLIAATLPSTTTKCFESVFEAPPDEVFNEDMPTCVVQVGNTREARLCGPVGSGMKRLNLAVTIDVFCWYDANDDLLGARHIDDILDGVDQALRASPNTDSGAVALMYEVVETTVHPPVNAIEEGDPAGMVLLHATRVFDASAFDAG